MEHVPVIFTQSGRADMGDPDDEANRICRFTLPNAKRYQLVGILARFTGGTGQADLEIHVDRKPLSNAVRFAYLLWKAEGIGTDGEQLHFRVIDDEREAWTYEEGDDVVVKWANPDSGNMNWTVEVRLKDATHVSQQ